MAYDFPNAPSMGQVANGYVWDGEKWLSAGTPSAAIATKKNYIINGAMMISQENGATAGTTFNFYPVDQFFLGNPIITGGVSIARVASPTPGGSPNRIRLTVVAADPTIDATDRLYIEHKIEGLISTDLRFGSNAAKTVTLQFGVKAPAGTYSCAFLSNANTRWRTAEYVIAAGEANTDVMKSVTIPGDTTGTWLSDNGVGLIVRWALACGTNFSKAPGAWGTGGNAIGSTNQFNFAGTNGNVFELFDVSLTEGTTAPPFTVPHYPDELLTCQRYWQFHDEIFIGGMYTIAGYGIEGNMEFPTMRAQPTATPSNLRPNNTTGLSIAALTIKSLKAQSTAVGTGGVGMTFAVVLNARI